MDIAMVVDVVGKEAPLPDSSHSHSLTYRISPHSIHWERLQHCL
jgi:hypothetical protein